MKYVITGAAGHISKPLVEQLLEAGQDVTVIGRNLQNLKPLTDKGAHAAIGSLEDMAFLKSTFDGADAVYTMVPPKMDAANWKEYIGHIGTLYAQAIKETGVRYVVNLSSIGGHMPQGAGPVSGLHLVEEALNTLTGVSVLHLRPGYFYTNFLSSISMVKHMNILGSNFGSNGNKQVLSEPADIATVAAEALLKLDFHGHSVRYLASDERPASDIAKELGAAIGKPDLPWVAFSNDQARDGMLQAGLPEEVATNYVEMGTALENGTMAVDYWKHRPQTLGNTKLEDFAKQFAAVYHAS